MATIVQATDLPSFERRDSANDNQDEQFAKLRETDALCLTNCHKFFPELAWKKVMEKLKKVSDIANCSGASPFFGDLLQEKREREVVLPIVFGILARRYSNAKNKDESYEETYVERFPRQQYERWMEPRRMTPIWKCRLVCRKWNKAIEEIHRNVDAVHYWMDTDFYTAKNVKLDRKWGADFFDDVYKIVMFLCHFEPTHYDALGKVSKKCPFLGRFVILLCAEIYMRDKQAYFNKLFEMFEKFGDQIWYLWFWWSDVESGNELVYIFKKLKHIVKLMPNLKLLGIRKYSGRSDSKDESKLQALRGKIETKPFPQLTKLEMISVDNAPGIFWNHLVNQNLQISRLEIKNSNFNGNCPLFVDKLPNLSQLSLWCYSVEIFEAFESYPFTLNLQKFYFHCTRRFPFVRWCRLFNTIQSKLNSDICTDLQVVMPRPLTDEQRMSVLKDSLFCRLQLANIERCNVYSYSRYSIDFLLQSRNSLREICLSCSLLNEYEIDRKLLDKQVIKFFGYEDKMERSNIYGAIPHLRKLDVKVLPREIIPYFRTRKHFATQVLVRRELRSSQALFRTSVSNRLLKPNQFHPARKNYKSIFLNNLLCVLLFLCFALGWRLLGEK